MDNIMYGNKARRNSWVYKFFLFLSFCWLSIYPITLGMISEFTYGFGNLLSSSNIAVIVASILFDALISWVGFELLFWFYRWILSFKIYSFIVPMESLRAETRLYFIFRNVILGLIYNLCFLFPYLYSYSAFFDLLVTMIVMLFYAKHLNSVYAETIVGHFVFKNFCYPIFVYEAIEVLCGLWVVLL